MTTSRFKWMIRIYLDHYIKQYDTKYLIAKCEHKQSTDKVIEARKACPF